MKQASKFKILIFDILYTGRNQRKWYYHIDDYFITSLILLNVVAIVLESFDSIYYGYQEELITFEIFSVIIFSIEYSLRVWVSNLRYPYLSRNRARLKYILSPLGLVDLLAVLPFYLPFIFNIPIDDTRALRVLRLLRVFKLNHYSKPFRLIGKVISYKKQELFITIVFSLIVMLLSSSIMYEIEHEAQPENFPNIFGAFWWAATTLTTIGYGDVVPVSDAGKALASITAIFGIALVAIPTGIISAGFLQVINEEKGSIKQKNNRSFIMKYTNNIRKKSLNKKSHIKRKK